MKQTNIRSFRLRNRSSDIRRIRTKIKTKLKILMWKTDKSKDKLTIMPEESPLNIPTVKFQRIKPPIIREWPSLLCRHLTTPSSKSRQWRTISIPRQSQPRALKTPSRNSSSRCVKIWKQKTKVSFSRKPKTKEHSSSVALSSNSWLHRSKSPNLL